MSKYDASTILVGAQSNVGTVRDVNQDSYYVGETAQGAIGVVADGMGGHVSGELASAMARDSVLKVMKRGESYLPLALAQAVQQANVDILGFVERYPEHSGMGTTLSTVVIDHQLAVIGHVGDSRVYLLRNNQLKQVTQDHTWVADRVRQGLLNVDEARHHQWRNLITNSVGTQETVRLELNALNLRSGDRLLICSDGLSMVLSDALLQQYLCKGTPAEAAAELIDRANERRTPDNLTAVVLEVKTVNVKPKSYAVPSQLPVSITLDATLESLRPVETLFPSAEQLYKLRFHPLFADRYWLLGCVLLALLFLYFVFF